MQLMPETARTVARTLREPWRSDADLFNPEFNIHYGGNYFKDLLSRFGSHVVLASAGYNAGPNRAKMDAYYVCRSGRHLDRNHSL